MSYFRPGLRGEVKNAETNRRPMADDTEYSMDRSRHVLTDILLFEFIQSRAVQLWVDSYGNLGAGPRRPLKDEYQSA